MKRHLDFSKIKFSENNVSTEESLQDVVPIDWDDEILNGKRKILITKQEKPELCVK